MRSNSIFVLSLTIGAALFLSGARPSFGASRSAFT